MAKDLVIVESPTKANTIKRYLGEDKFEVLASVGHIRDLPAKAPKGKQKEHPVPGVNLKTFEPNYEIDGAKKKVVTQLKKAAKEAKHIYFATDLDREGEAIAWHLAEILKVDPLEAKRVVFNAITKEAITEAFKKPRTIDIDRTNAQQARRILDRIVGYQASPLLWKKVAGGLSAGRVQSVAVRLIVERENEIISYIPNESWNVNIQLTNSLDEVINIGNSWSLAKDTLDENGKLPTKKYLDQWLSSKGALSGELISIDNNPLDLTIDADKFSESSDNTLQEDLLKTADLSGLNNIKINSKDGIKGKGPKQRYLTLRGDIQPNLCYEVSDIETKKTKQKASAPFITSTLLATASSKLGFGSARTRRASQSLYEGVKIKGSQVGLITYTRTDSTHLSSEAIKKVRSYIKESFGEKYLPKKPIIFESSNTDAQEAHEAIRPTDVSRKPDELPSSINEDQRKLYRLIWERFVSCQMNPAEIANTNALLTRCDKKTGATIKLSGRQIIFDGYRLVAMNQGNDDAPLPNLKKGAKWFPFSIDFQQKFSNPPPRFSEAGLIKKLESEGIGRPSTYVEIIDKIQRRNYVEKEGSSFRPTDLGEVVTDKMIEAFPILMATKYTREMEEKLDLIAEGNLKWKEMLKTFYGNFSSALEKAQEEMVHAKAEIQAAPYACPECGSTTSYRFGRNGKFLSCSSYPDCKFGCPVNREGQPQMRQLVDICCPIGEGQMELRRGRFGPFICAVDDNVSFIINIDPKGNIKLPQPPPLKTNLKCPKCDLMLNMRRSKVGKGGKERPPWFGCSGFPKCRGRGKWTELSEQEQKNLLLELSTHEKEHPIPKIYRMSDKSIIEESTPLNLLILEGEDESLPLHPDFQNITTN